MGESPLQEWFGCPYESCGCTFRYNVSLVFHIRIHHDVCCTKALVSQMCNSSSKRSLVGTSTMLLFI
jgi:hypothetical protein